MRRGRFPLFRFIPKGVTLIVRSKKVNAVIYLYESGGVPKAIGYRGKSAKPAFHYRYPTIARRAVAMREWLGLIEAVAESKAASRAIDKAFVHTLQVGDVLRSSWGYDQTNIDYYQITKLIGKAMVEAREIAAISVDRTSDMTGSSVPDQNHFIGEPMRKRVLPGNVLDVRNAKFGRARLMTPKIIAGAKVYEASNWTAYA